MVLKRIRERFASELGLRGSPASWTEGKVHWHFTEERLELTLHGGGGTTARLCIDTEGRGIGTLFPGFEASTPGGKLYLELAAIVESICEED